jgi:hypothetical protein
MGRGAVGLGGEANGVRRSHAANPDKWMDGGYDLGDVAHIGGEEHFGGVGVEEQADRRVQRGFEETGQPDAGLRARTAS